MRNKNGKGWRNEPVRHSLAAQGVETSTEDDSLTLGDVIDKTFNLSKLYHLTATGMATEDSLKLSSEKTKRILELNEEADYSNEWIADLDMYDEREIDINDVVISDESDESELNWQDHTSGENQEKGEEADPDNCVGYIHYHPKSVDKRATAQDYILTMTIDEMRNQKNKDRFRPTMFGVVRDQTVRFYYLKPSEEERKHYTEKLEDLRDGQTSNADYFDTLEEITDSMKEKDILFETKDIKLKLDDEDG